VSGGGRWSLRTVGESVLEELARFGAQGALGDAVAAWPDAVGAAIAEQAWPARIARDGTLTVATSSSVWAFELTQLEATIRERLAAMLGDAGPARLRFVPGRLPERGAERPEGAPPPPPLEVGAEARRRGEELARPIEDEELRALVARAAATSLARAEARPHDRPL
jgi:hypothetical protein